jgi:hypothetical protein
MVTDVGRRGHRSSVTAGGVSSVAARTDHDARTASRSGHPHTHSLPPTATRPEASRQVAVLRSVRTLAHALGRWLIQWLEKGASVPDASIRKVVEPP